MTRARVRWLALAAALIVLAAGYLSLNRRVTVLADGNAYELATRAVTVRGALHALGLQLGAKDQVEPSPFSLLHDGLIIAVHRAAWVQINADGKSYSLITAERDPAALLAHWELALGTQDRLLLAGAQVEMNRDLPSAPFLALEIRRPVQITLDQDGETTQFLSSAPTLGQALAEEGIHLQAADRLQPVAETPLDAPVDATLTRARAIEITLGDKTVSLVSAATTVGEALAEAGISLQGLDRSDPEEDQAVPADGGIRVRRISESVQLEQTTLPHETEWQPDANAELDTTSVIQAGQDGVQATRTRVRYENGEEVSRKEEGQRVLVQAKTQINGYGTKIVIHTTVVDGVTIEYYRAIQVYTTWYSACNSGTTACMNGTASGVPLTRGVIATYVSWYRVLKFATVYVPGYGFGTIADTGAYPDRRPWIDLAYSDSDTEHRPNGYVIIYFTTPVPAYVPPILPVP
jgi:uncharacterized protein YabE (DUF348 family)